MNYPAVNAAASQRIRKNKPMMEEKARFWHKIRDNIEKYDLLCRGDRVLIGLSGGADSVCLLFVLKELRKSYDLDILACHVHHGIRGHEADHDLAFCEELCRRWQVTYEAVYLDIPALAQKNHRSEEEEGRIQRYAVFSEMMTDRHFNKLVLAHHMDDQAETVLHNMVRGTGIRGLASLQHRREMLGRAWTGSSADENCRTGSAAYKPGSPTDEKCRPGSAALQPIMIRPLLCVTRREIEKYLASENVSYCEDSTNASDDYLRNKIRHHVLPYLNRELNAGTTRHLAELSETAGEAADFIEEEASRRLAAYLESPGPEYPNDGSVHSVRNQYCGGNQFEQKISDLAHSSCNQDCCGNQPCPENTEIHLSISFFTREPAAIIYEGLRQLLARLSGTSKDIGRVHLKMIRNLACRQTGAEIDLPYGIKAERSYDNIVFALRNSGKSHQPLGDSPTKNLTDSHGSPDRAVTLVIPGKTYFDDWVITAEILENSGLDYPKNRYTKWFDYDKMSCNPDIRYRLSGDFLTITGKGAHQSLSDYLINEKVPARDRDKIPLLSEGQEVHWVIGYRMGERAKVSAATRRILSLDVEKNQKDSM